MSVKISELTSASSAESTDVMILGTAAGTRKISEVDLQSSMLASAPLTGTPTAPTASAGTNTNQVASTAFATKASGVVQANLDNRHLTTKFAITTASWSTDATTVNSIAYYTYTITLTAVYDAYPEVFIGYDTPPTADEQDAYNCIKYASVDAETLKLTLYAESVPTADFNIRVRGVK